MTADVEKKSHHHHHHHCRHNHTRHTHKKMVSLKSVERFANLPVVESAHAYYEKIKSSNTLIKWGLVPAETGVWLAVESAMPVVNYFEKPVSTIDSIFCQGLDVIEANLPIVKYPPDLVYNMTKDYVNSKVVSPMLKRADSVKQLSLAGANNLSEIAANRLNSAINVAEKYVDKYLPEMADAPDSTTGPSSVVENQKNKPVETLEHVNRFSRKLQRRLTERTLAEAKALRQQGADTARTVVYLLDLLARNPKLFIEKAKEMWEELSKDEPENQIPPANIEQLIGMVVRETARRIVHLSNYTRARALMLSEYSKQAAHIGTINAIWWADQLIKTVHLESAMEATTKQIARIHHERLVEIVRNLKTAMLAKNEASCVAPGQVLALPPPPKSTPQPKTPPRTDSTSSTSSTASYSSSSSSAVSLTNNKPALQSGDTPSAKENEQDIVVA